MFVKRIAFPVVSGVLTVIALFNLLPWLAAVALVPLLYAIKKATLTETLKATAFFGISFGLCFFSWIPASAGVYNGEKLSGLLVLLLFTLVLGIYFLLIFGLYKYLEKKAAPFKNALLLGAVVIILDYLKDSLFGTMPWFDFHFGNALAGSAYTIQLAELGGVYILSFFAVFFNVLLVAAIDRQFPVKWLVVVLAVFLGINLGVYSYRSSKEGEGIKVNLLTENIDPRTKWEDNGNQIVNQLLQLSDRAATQPAALNVWTETVVPWTYLPNDDFLNAILKPTLANGTLTIMGMSTQVDKGRVYDSAYLLHPDGKVLGRYDKNYPLAVIESEVKGKGAALNENRGTSVAAGKQAFILPMPQAKIGVYICNEASLPQLASKLTNSGADFFVNISNDGWFANSFIPKQHFYYNRLRAVENRRYVVANSNLGYKGLIAANGDMEIHPPRMRSELTQVTVWKQSAQTLYQLAPWAILLLSILLIISLKYIRK
ncbi:MAG: apolipoprotein N-acyltransferase [Pedobacter sp.]|nr:MAG: apolipoprotein N-acyltransferase [Pedobacter sp.]